MSNIEIRFLIDGDKEILQYRFWECTLGDWRPIPGGDSSNKYYGWSKWKEPERIMINNKGDNNETKLD